MFRAILTQSSPALLLHPLSFPLLPPPPEAAALCTLPPPSSLYFHVLLPSFLSHCHSPSPQIRYYAFQVLDVWFGQASTVVSTLPSPSLTSSFQSSFPPLLSLMALNWEHPYRVIIGANKRLFLHYIALLSQLSQPEKPSLQPILSPLVQSILSHHDRGAYHMLHALLPHVNAVQLLGSSPRLLPHILSAAKYQPMWGLACALLQRALGQAWEEMKAERVTADEGIAEEARQAGGSERAGRAARKERRQRRIEGDLAGGGPVRMAHEVGAKWRELWLSEVVTALLSDEDQVRQTLSTTLVLFCIKLDPHALPSLMAAIQRLPEASTPTFFRLRALMASSPPVAALASSPHTNCIRA